MVIRYLLPILLILTPAGPCLAGATPLPELLAQLDAIVQDLREREPMACLECDPLGGVIDSIKNQIVSGHINSWSPELEEDFGGRPAWVAYVQLVRQLASIMAHRHMLYTSSSYGASHWLWQLKGEILTMDSARQAATGRGVPHAAQLSAFFLQQRNRFAACSEQVRIDQGACSGGGDGE